MGGHTLPGRRNDSIRRAINQIAICVSLCACPSGVLTLFPCIVELYHDGLHSNCIVRVFTTCCRPRSSPIPLTFFPPFSPLYYSRSLIKKSKRGERRAAQEAGGGRWKTETRGGSVCYRGELETNRCITQNSRSVVD